ncbi:DUF6090 family protein [Gemmatimonadota bacterium]
MDSGVLAALAEIGIIVAGVLIALAVDQWRKARSERAMESHYLRGLLNDLGQDNDRLRQYREDVQEALDSAENLLEILKGKVDADQGTLAKILIRAAYGWEPVYTLATYTELSSGNLHLIQNAALKGRIVDYYSGILTGERANSRVTPQIWYDPGVEPLVLVLWRVLPLGDWFAWHFGEPADFDIDAVIADLRAIPEVPDYLEACRRCRVLQLGKFKLHSDQASELHTQVQAELQRLAS